ncbi:uncharacterized protein LOC131692440 [Topomyia yanbarensis]|uniref:uncharacterized protein LOC131692440 n=1 Tax=Topomyia yanbarensis TaxID=2498891 RepID=UPI00273BBDE5|nr:uncharacterized protein LOC131692440 [Topomyia yanbarensis]
MDQHHAVHVKTEPIEPDLEHDIPRFLVQTSAAPNIPTTVEIVDLTNDEFISEFRHFLSNVQYSRKQGNKKVIRQKELVVELISLQVVHLQLISFYQEAYVGTLFGIDFRSVIVYGRVTPGPVKQHNNTHIYKLDDGSGTVEVYYAHALPRDVDKLTDVNKCEDILKTRNPLNDEQVPENPDHKADLKLLLSLVKSHCQRRLEYFQLGTRCFVIGRPFLNRFDQVSIYAHSMYADGDKDGKSAEVFWKTHLALCYEREYSAACRQ